MPLASVESLPDGTACIPFFYGIDSPFAEALGFTCQKAVTDGAKALYIPFSSPGGNVDLGLALRAHLMALGVPLVTHNLANIDSIAIPLFLAGELRLVSPGSVFRFHPVNSLARAGEELNREIAATLVESFDREEQRLTTLYADCGVRDGRNLMRTSGVILAKDAVAFGLAHKVQPFAMPRGAKLLEIVTPG